MTIPVSPGDTADDIARDIFKRIDEKIDEIVEKIINRTTRKLIDAISDSSKSENSSIGQVMYDTFQAKVPRFRLKSDSSSLMTDPSTEKKSTNEERGTNDGWSAEETENKEREETKGDEEEREKDSDHGEGEKREETERGKDDGKCVKHDEEEGEEGGNREYSEDRHGNGGGGIEEVGEEEGEEREEGEEGGGDDASSSPSPSPGLSRHHFCYVLYNRFNEQTYVGYTNDPKNRIRRHNCEIVGGAKYTSRYKKKRPDLAAVAKDKGENVWEYLALIHSPLFDTSSTSKGSSKTALSFEWHLKHPVSFACLKGLRGSELASAKKECVLERASTFRGPVRRLRAISRTIRHPKFIEGDFDVYVNITRVGKFLPEEERIDNDMVNDRVRWHHGEDLLGSLFGSLSSSSS